jgi:hypothetical protein
MLFIRAVSSRAPLLLAAAGAATTASSTTASPTFCDSSTGKTRLLTPAQSADVAMLVLDRFSFPLIPQSIQLVVTSKLVECVVTELEKQSDITNSTFATLMTETLDDGLTHDRVKTLCDQLAPAVASQHLPLLTQAQQREELLDRVGLGGVVE